MTSFDLLTATPTPDDEGTEVTVGSYARVAVTSEPTTFPVGDPWFYGPTITSPGALDLTTVRRLEPTHLVDGFGYVGPFATEPVDPSGVNEQAAGRDQSSAEDDAGPRSAVLHGAGVVELDQPEQDVQVAVDEPAPLETAAVQVDPLTSEHAILDDGEVARENVARGDDAGVHLADVDRFALGHDVSSLDDVGAQSAPGNRGFAPSAVIYLMALIPAVLALGLFLEGNRGGAAFCGAVTLVVVIVGRLNPRETR